MKELPGPRPKSRPRVPRSLELRGRSAARCPQPPVPPVWFGSRASELPTRILEIAELIHHPFGVQAPTLTMPLPPPTTRPAAVARTAARLVNSPVSPRFP